MNNIAAAIFAGGKSSRFGSPKINAKIDGVEFGEIIISRLKQAEISEVALVGGSRSDAARWSVNFLADEFDETGPLGALITAMHWSNSKNLLILPCDVPFIDVETCNRLSDVGADFDVRVAQTESPQWLCSTWNTKVCNVVEDAFSNGERAIHAVVKSLRVEYVPVSKYLLRNINSLGDLEN